MFQVKPMASFLYLPLFSMALHCAFSTNLFHGQITKKQQSPPENKNVDLEIFLE